MGQQWFNQTDILNCYIITFPSVFEKLLWKAQIKRKESVKLTWERFQPHYGDKTDINRSGELEPSGRAERDTGSFITCK